MLRNSVVVTSSVELPEQLTVEQGFAVVAVVLWLVDAVVVIVNSDSVEAPGYQFVTAYLRKNKHRCIKTIFW